MEYSEFRRCYFAQEKLKQYLYQNLQYVKNTRHRLRTEAHRACRYR
jgi:hypothetical protein